MNGRDVADGEMLSRLEAAKRAGSGVVQQLGDGDCLSVVSFADEAITHLAHVPLNARGRAGP